MKPAVDTPLDKLHEAALNAGLDLRAHMGRCRTCAERFGLCVTGYGLVRASQAAWRAYQQAGGRPIA